MRKHLIAVLVTGSAWLMASTAAHSQSGSGSRAATTPKPAQAALSADEELTRKAAAWAAALQLSNTGQEAAVRAIITTHLRAIHAFAQAHPYSETPAGINPTTGKPLSVLERQLIAQSALPAAVHDSLLLGLRRQLTPAQVEFVLDQYTIGKVAFTLRGYQAIVPDLTPTEEALLLTNLKLAREQAVDYPTMKQISAIFEIYKTRNEEYLNTHGRNWRALFKAYVDAANAQKAASKPKASAPPASAPK